MFVGGGGGSGYFAYGSFSVMYGQVYNVTVGAGGTASICYNPDSCYSGGNGGKSSFGDLLVAAGGISASNAEGGYGGSDGGGGTSLATSNVVSGTGGTGGSNGGNSDYIGGVGQGSFPHFSDFKKATFSFGSPAYGVVSTLMCHLGGGGAAGILVNGNGPFGGRAACCTYCPPDVASGYGAGGGGGCYDFNYYNASQNANQKFATIGGLGALGFVYVEY